MTVGSGRQMSVLIALAAVLLVAVAAPATTLATDPPQLDRFMEAVGLVESNGNHTARNAASGAYGRYQILPDNWRQWAGRYLGDADARPTPANQERVARAKMASLFRWLGSWRRVSYWWLTGSSSTSAWSPAASEYVARVMAALGGSEADEPARESGRHYSERSSTIRYTGTWDPASHAGYAGGEVRYATLEGDSAAITFSGSRIAWYGPVGPTRGKARIIIDGLAVKTIDLARSSFRPRAILYSQSWDGAGRHELIIEVVATRGHKLVAIDELVVAP